MPPRPPDVAASSLQERAQALVARVTSLHRSLVPTRPLEAYALGWALVVGIGAAVSHDPWSGVRGGGAVLFAWMITREIAPGARWPALLAPPLALAAAIPGRSDLLACFTVLVAARLAVRSVGDQPTTIDGVGLVVLAGVASVTPVGLPAALVLAAMLMGERPLLLRALGLAALAAAIAVGALEGTLALGFATAPGPHQAWLVLCAAGAAAGIVALALCRRGPLASVDDRHRRPLSGGRLTSARLACLATLGAAVAWTGWSAGADLSAVVAALVATSLAGARPRSASGTVTT